MKTAALWIAMVVSGTANAHAQTTLAEFNPAGHWQIEQMLGTSLWLTSADGSWRVPLTQPTGHLLDLLALQYAGVDTVAIVEKLLTIDRELDVEYSSENHEVHLRGPNPEDDHLTDAAFHIVAQAQRRGSVNFLAGVTESVSERPLLEVCGQDCLHTLDTQVLLRFTSNEVLLATVKKVVRFNVRGSSLLMLFPGSPILLATLMRMPDFGTTDRVHFNLEWQLRVSAQRTSAAVTP